MIETGSLAPGDRAAWEALARGYKTFYRTEVPDEGYETMWRRLREGTEVHAVAARAEGRLVGIAHYLFHSTAWTADSCYLEDLYVDEAARGRGVARALIERVADAARERGGRPSLLDHPGGQRHRPGPVRQGGGVPRVHPLRPPPRVGAVRGRGGHTVRSSTAPRPARFHTFVRFTP
ncbi:GNAT family N-acetyltransferase [Streptomyces sp. NBC_00425]|uniref:GNAT family N-acetyltransferase n=1 Tax=Streptomyces sp. NBC_00425 TaxID=2975740 RepID=UPI002E201563